MIAQSYWDNFYSEQPFKSGKGPLQFLVEMTPRLQKGKTLDVGMGEGANAVFLAQKGFQVKGFDISPVAIERANKLAKETGVSAEFKSADLDLYLLGLMEFDTIIMTYFKPTLPRYYSELVRSLKQGGTILIHSYSTEEQKEVLGHEDAYKNFYYRSNEIIQNLKGMRFLYYNETTIDNKHVVQCLAQKPLDKDVAKYNLFDMGTVQEKPRNTHLDLAESLFKKK
ncbi:MAG: hypothetical protein A4S09_11980 [Proteobacteria bacterium SG_bin7]|nr:MAG: hypothetical protein A4S09_11980 [Proteobacteria bacterium SG_bin7]